jgi:hypothetical protein
MQRDKSALLFVAFMAILSPVHGDDARDQHRAMLANKRTEANRTEVGRLNSSRDETKNCVGDATPEQLKYMSASERAEYNKLLARREQTIDRISEMTRKSARPSAIGGARRTLKNTQDEIDRLVAKAAERMSYKTSFVAMQERQKAEAEQIAAEMQKIETQNRIQQEQDRKIEEKRQIAALVDAFKAVNTVPGEQIQGVSLSIQKSHINGISKQSGI